MATLHHSRPATRVYRIKPSRGESGQRALELTRELVAICQGMVKYSRLVKRNRDKWLPFVEAEAKRVLEAAAAYRADVLAIEAKVKRAAIDRARLADGDVIPPPKPRPAPDGMPSRPYIHERSIAPFPDGGLGYPDEAPLGVDPDEGTP